MESGRVIDAPKSSIKIYNNIPHAVWLETTKIHGRNPDKSKSGPPPKSGTMVFVVHLNTTKYSHKSFRYNIYMEIKIG